VQQYNLKQGEYDLNLSKPSMYHQLHRQKKIMKQNIGRGKFTQFLILFKLGNQKKDILTYVQYLKALYKDLEFGFDDTLTMKIPSWIINQFA
jgi:hypothetical protein